jgi:hypothetical protein
MGHARHAWTCPCGKTVRGNGGRASHRRACDIWAEEELARLKRMLADVPAAQYEVRRQWEARRDHLKERLGHD